MHARYSAEVTMTDHWLGHFMDRFYELGLEENTMIVLLSEGVSRIDDAIAENGATSLRDLGRVLGLPAGCEETEFCIRVRQSTGRRFMYEPRTAIDLDRAA